MRRWRTLFGWGKPGSRRLNGPLVASLRSDLEKEGLRFGLSPDEADDLLARIVGEKRFRKFCRTMEGVRAGTTSVSKAYAQFQTVYEAQCLMSAQADALLGANTAVIELSGVLAGRHLRVAEVGCFSGGVLRFLARQLPGTQFVGLDRLPALLKDAKRNSPGNVDFLAWDYQERELPGDQRFDLILGTFPIDLESAASLALEGETDADATMKGAAQDVGEAAKQWRNIATESGRLVISLRIPDVHCFAGVVQATAIAGWHATYEDSAKVRVDDEEFPVLCFSAGGSRQLLQDDVNQLAKRWERLPTLKA